MGSSRLHPSVRKFLNRRVTLASSKSRTPDSNVMSLIWTRAFPRKYSLADTLSMLWCVDLHMRSKTVSDVICTTE